MWLENHGPSSSTEGSGEGAEALLLHDLLLGGPQLVERLLQATVALLQGFFHLLALGDVPDDARPRFQVTPWLCSPRESKTP